jgi:hypothetical protein
LMILFVSPNKAEIEPSVGPVDINKVVYIPSRLWQRA